MTFRRNAAPAFAAEILHTLSRALAYFSNSACSSFVHGSNGSASNISGGSSKRKRWRRIWLYGFRNGFWWVGCGRMIGKENEGRAADSLRE